MSRVVLFLDQVCPKPYAPNQFEGCGGTEQTVVKVAEGLATLGFFDVRVEQHCRQEATGIYLPLGCTTKADYVVCLRSPVAMVEARKRFPGARIYLWSHDLSSPNYGQTLPYYLEARCDANIVVSNFHKTQVVDRLQVGGYEGQFPVKVIYNPIDDSLVPDGTPYDRNKLVWTSSPHKGLDYALAVFENLRSFNPDFKLYIANPGYLPSNETIQPGVTSLGSLAHSDVIRHLRDSLCLFYPNVVFAETFGLVLAEADAVGTPVLTHSFGAAPEVTFHPQETMDCRDPKAVIERVLHWRDGGRPKVKANPKFRLSEVLKSWTRLLA